MNKKGDADNDYVKVMDDFDKREAEPLTWERVYSAWQRRTRELGAAPTDEQLFQDRQASTTERERIPWGFDVAWYSRALIAVRDPLHVALNADRRRGLEITGVFLHDSLGDAERTALVWLKACLRHQDGGGRSGDMRGRLFACRVVERYAELDTLIFATQPRIEWHHLCGDVLPGPKPLDGVSRSSYWEQLPCVLSWRDMVGLCAEVRAIALGTQVCQITFAQEDLCFVIPGREDRWENDFETEKWFGDDHREPSRWSSCQQNAKRLAEQFKGKW